MLIVFNIWCATGRPLPHQPAGPFPMEGLSSGEMGEEGETGRSGKQKGGKGNRMGKERTKNSHPDSLGNPLLTEICQKRTSAPFCVFSLLGGNSRRFRLLCLGNSPLGLRTVHTTVIIYSYIIYHPPLDSRLATIK